MIELFSSDTPNGKKIGIMLEEIGFDYKVTKLDRVIFACLTKKNIPRGHWRHLTEEEMNILRMTT